MPFLAFDWQLCLHHFLQHIYEHSRSDGSHSTYQRILTEFFADSRTPDCYTKSDVEAFLGKPCRRGGKLPSTSYRNLRLTVLSSFYTYAANYTLPGPNGKPRLLLDPALIPTRGMRGGKPARCYRALSTDELTRLFAAIPKDTVMGLRDRAIFLLYFYTARRRNEIARLRYGDIWRGMVFDEQGKAREGWLYRFQGKGSSQQDDVAELPEPAYQAIVRYLKASGRYGSIQAGDPLFVAIGPPTGGGIVPINQPLTGYTMQYLLHRYARKAGIVRPVTIHAFRYSVAQQLRTLGVDILEIQHLLRHKRIETTMLYLQMLTGTAAPGIEHFASKFASL